MSALFRAELFKLVRQPSLLFWGFLSVPVFAMIFKILLDGMVFVRMRQVSPDNVDILMSAAKSLGISGNSLAHLLYAIGIASIFFAEYRFSTWRILVPRASRFQLWAAKYLACLAFLCLSLVLVVISNVLLHIVTTLLFEQRLPNMAIRADSFVTLFLAFMASLLELSVLTAIVAAITTLTRSMIAAVIPAFMLTLGASLVALYVGPTRNVIPLPSPASEALRDWILSGGPASLGWSGLAILSAWLVVAAAIGGVAFWRQQLSSE